MFTGQIIDAVSKESIPGALIFINDAPKAAADSDGKFSIEVKAGDKARAHMTGYQDAPFGGTTTGSATIEMKPAMADISEVVVVAKGGKPWYKKKAVIAVLLALGLLAGYRAYCHFRKPAM